MSDNTPLLTTSVATATTAATATGVHVNFNSNGENFRKRNISGFNSAVKATMLVKRGSFSHSMRSIASYDDVNHTRSHSQVLSSVRWENISFAVDEKTILHNVSGEARAGELTCIMGPSGAGKSSLLNIIAGRNVSSAKGKTVGGAVWLGDERIDLQSNSGRSELRSTIAYVLQESTMLKTQTPRETLVFSAALRLPSAGAEERNDLVEEMLIQLGLMESADVPVGDETRPGISGGQRKRLQVGMDLLGNPGIIFLDEPTTGLDSYAAWRVITMLRQLAAETGCVVMATIHQPSSQVFELFDRCCLLAAGYCVYGGSRKMLKSYMQSSPFWGSSEIKDTENLSDKFAFEVQGPGFDTEGAASEWDRHRRGNSCKPSGSDGSPKGCDDSMLDVDQSVVTIDVAADKDTSFGNEHIHAYDSMLDVDDSGIQHLIAKKHARVTRSRRTIKAPFFRCFYYLILREIRKTVRDKAALIARFGTSIFLNVIVGLCFQGIGVYNASKLSDPAAASSAVASHFSAMVQLCISGMFGLSTPLLLSFPAERPIFMREYSSGLYSVVAYGLSKAMVEIPMTILQALAIVNSAAWLLQLHGNLLLMSLVIAGLGLSSASMALLIGAIASEAKVALQLSPLLQVPQILFSGFFVPLAAVPIYMRWAQYLCVLKYAVDLAAIVEFKLYPELVPVEGYRPYVDSYLEGNEIKESRALLYCGVLLALFIGTRIAAMVVLVRKAATY